MRKHFLKIVSAATAAALALALGAGNAIAVEENSVVKVSENDARLTIITKEYTEAYEKAFEAAYEDELSKADFETFDELLAQGIFTEDPHVIAREKAEERAQAECEKLGLYTVLELKPIEDWIYKGWTGTFEVDSIEGTTLYFSTPDKFSCSGGARTASMTAKSGYEGNYKSGFVQLTYANGTVSKKNSGSNNKTHSVTAPAKTGKIVKAHYELRMFDGTGSTSNYSEVAIINLVAKDS